MNRVIYIYIYSKKNNLITQPNSTQLNEKNRELGYELYSSCSGHQPNQPKISSSSKKFLQTNPIRISQIIQINELVNIIIFAKGLYYLFMFEYVLR